MSKVYNVAVVGATGAVGEAMLSILEERQFPVGEVYVLASSNSVGKRIPFKEGSLRVDDLANFDFSKVQIDIRFFPSYMLITRVSKGTPHEIYNNFVNPPAETKVVSNHIDFKPVTEYTFKKDSIIDDFIV